MTTPRRPRAFISSSLRKEDSHFVVLIRRIVEQFGFEPFGPVGLLSGAPLPIWQQMRDNIRSADCVVLAATPRYVQRDVREKRKTGMGISEMLHTEVGMAVAEGRPILAFAAPGTDLGHFLPQCTQYIEIDPDDPDALKDKLPLLANYFRSALALMQGRWQAERRADVGKMFQAALTGIGAVALFGAVMDAIFQPADEEDSEEEAIT